MALLAALRIPVVSYRIMLSRIAAPLQWKSVSPQVLDRAHSEPSLARLLSGSTQLMDAHRCSTMGASRITPGSR